MSLQLPPQAPVSAPAAPAAGPGFPVYEPPTEKPDPQNPLGEYHKVAETDPDAARELLFTIGGTPFYMPKNPSPQLGFKLMRDTKRFGQIHAIATLIEELLGPNALDALADAPNIGDKDWEVISDILADKVLGRMQNMPGKG